MPVQYALYIQSEQAGRVKSEDWVKLGCVLNSGHARYWKALALLLSETGTATN